MRCLFYLAVFILAPLAAVAEPAPKPAPKVRITVSKETTYVTGPLRPDGTVDYAAALNQRLGRGVTPENNAAVLLWQAAGPAHVEKEFREAYFRLLGAAAPPEEGDYFKDFGDHAVAALAGRGSPEEMEKALEKLYDQWAEAEVRPWIKEESPELARWLESQKEYLLLAVEASRRPRYFSPLASGQAEPLVECFLRANDLAHFRAMARALCTRATLRAGTGEAGDASHDLLAARRLARLKAQGPFLVDILVGGALEQIACETAAGIAQSGRLPVEDLRKLQADLAALPPLRSVADTMDEGERVFGLDTLLAVSREPDKMLRLLMVDEWGLNPGIEKVLPRAIQLAGTNNLDWDELFRATNAHYDRHARILRLPGRARRDEEWEKYEGELKAVVQRAGKLAESPEPSESEKPSPAAAARELADILMAWSVSSPFRYWDDRRSMELALARLAIALAIYRAEQGKYPARLDGLAPKYIDRVPADPFADSPLHYHPAEDGYVLYSVGLNGKDDGGRGLRDREGEEPWDDIVVRTPRKPKGGK